MSIFNYFYALILSDSTLLCLNILISLKKIVLDANACQICLVFWIPKS
jgi:hypothetical protein